MDREYREHHEPASSSTDNQAGSSADAPMDDQEGDHEEQQDVDEDMDDDTFMEGVDDPEPGDDDMISDKPNDMRSPSAGNQTLPPLSSSLTEVQLSNRRTE